MDFYFLAGSKKTTTERVRASEKKATEHGKKASIWSLCCSNTPHTHMYTTNKLIPHNPKYIHAHNPLCDMRNLIYFRYILFFSRIVFNIENSFALLLLLLIQYHFFLFHSTQICELIDFQLSQLSSIFAMVNATNKRTNRVQKNIPRTMKIMFSLLKRTRASCYACLSYDAKSYFSFNMTIFDIYIFPPTFSWLPKQFRAYIKWHVYSNKPRPAIAKNTVSYTIYAIFYSAIIIINEAKLLTQFRCHWKLIDVIGIRMICLRWRKCLRCKRAQRRCHVRQMFAPLSVRTRQPFQSVHVDFR